MPTRRRGLEGGLALVLLLAASAPLRAQWLDRVAVSGGAAQVLRGEVAFEAGTEVRLLPQRFWLFGRELPELVPAGGVLASSAGALYLYAGFRLEQPLGRRFRVCGHTAAGVYQLWDGFDLGGTVEFRSGLELGVRVGDDDWLGLDLYHLSNAGLSEKNPGTESLMLTYSVSLW